MSAALTYVYTYNVGILAGINVDMLSINHIIYYKRIRERENMFIYSETDPLAQKRIQS